MIMIAEIITVTNLIMRIMLVKSIINQVRKQRHLTSDSDATD
jgi:hypothetical protein